MTVKWMQRLKNIMIPNETFKRVSTMDWIASLVLVTSTKLAFTSGGFKKICQVNATNDLVSQLQKLLKQAFYVSGRRLQNFWHSLSEETHKNTRAIRLLAVLKAIIRMKMSKIEHVDMNEDVERWSCQEFSVHLARERALICNTLS